MNSIIIIIIERERERESKRERYRHTSIRGRISDKGTHRDLEESIAQDEPMLDLVRVRYCNILHRHLCWSALGNEASWVRGVRVTR
mgnify:CR=1 FL=1